MFGKSVRYLDIKDIVVLVKGKIIRIESPADLDYLIREDNLADFVLLERYLIGFCPPPYGQTNEYDGGNIFFHYLKVLFITFLCLNCLYEPIFPDVFFCCKSYVRKYLYIGIDY